MMTIDARSDIDLANQRYPIDQAYLDIGMEGTGSGKLECPFSDLFHMDRDSRSFRLFLNTNTAHCYAGCGYFTPVKLVALSEGLSEADAAESILVRTGYVAPDYNSRWEALTAVKAEVDTDSLSEALKIACARMDPAWEIRQFEDDIATRFRKCLAALAKVRTDEDASKWLAMTKKIMHQALGDHS